MVWFIVGAVVLIVIVKFAFAVDKDSSELSSIELSKKFNIIVSTLNEKVYNSYGKVHKINDRTFNLYSPSSQIIQFFYSTGHLTITWRKKTYDGREIVFEKQFNDLRQINDLQQKEIAEYFYSEGVRKMM